MKKLAAVALMLSLVGCTTATTGGQCVGLADTKTPGVTYSLSYWNIFLAAIFSETIVVPIVVVAKYLECPE